MKKEYSFFTSCVGYPQNKVNDLYNMIDAAIDIKPKTFFQYVDRKEVEQMLGYDKIKDVLKIDEDYSVSFHRSKFKGKRCYYVRWSAIEFIFTKN